MATDDSSGRVSNGVIYCSLQQQLACFWTVVSCFVCVLPILTYTHMLTCISTLTPIGHLHKHAYPYSHLCKYEFTHKHHKHIYVHKQAHVCVHGTLAFFQQYGGLLSACAYGI